jgi:hypothetical protein
MHLAQGAARGVCLVAPRQRACFSCKECGCAAEGSDCRRGRFTSDMYAPGLGFLMFAVGVNLRLEAFREVFRRPQARLCGIASSSAACCSQANMGRPRRGGLSAGAPS